MYLTALAKAGRLRFRISLQRSTRDPQGEEKTWLVGRKWRTIFKGQSLLPVWQAQFIF